MSFFKKRFTVFGRKTVFAKDEAIVKVIMKEFTIPDSNARCDGDSVSDAEDVGPPLGDRRVDVLVLQYEVAENRARIGSCCTVVIFNPVKFDYAVSLLSDGLSFRRISKVVKDNRDRVGAAGVIGCVCDGDASNFAPITCAFRLQILDDMMWYNWAYSLATAVSTNDFGNSHLDVRIRILGIGVADNQRSFHLLEIPLSRRHTAPSHSLLYSLRFLMRFFRRGRRRLSDRLETAPRIRLGTTLDFPHGLPSFSLAESSMAFGA
ncbi:unnamed protein product [Agarophyton chilense]